MCVPTRSRVFKALYQTVLLIRWRMASPTARMFVVAWPLHWGGSGPVDPIKGKPVHA